MTDAVQAGTSYSFMVKAVNKWGSATEFSNMVTVLAASRPAQILVAPVTSVDATDGSVLITWTEADPQGSALDSYTVEVKNSLGSWVEPECAETAAELLS